MSRRAVPLAALVALSPLAALAVAAPSAMADVRVEVPTRFLGGPIWPALPLPPASADPAATGDGAPSRAPAGAARILSGPAAMAEGVPVTMAAPSLSVVHQAPAAPAEPDPDADDGTDDVPDPSPDPSAPTEPPPPVPAAPPDVAATAPAYGRLLSPAPAGWLMWQTPTLRWKATPGARYYNVQIFRGTRRILNAWPSGTRLTVPEDVLRQGRTYVWVVWPGSGPRAAATYGPPVGRSTFAVTLRPRVVFRAARDGGTVGEVRPHIPYGTLRLERPRAVAARVPAQVTLTRRGRFLLPVPKASAERIGATLRDRGPAPPVGLRG
ncbi:MAG: hypothetical protein AB7V62_09830 [Thermoleophilia bacterium]